MALSEADTKEKARRLMFNSNLRDFPIVLEMYMRSFELSTDRTVVSDAILEIIRTSVDHTTAYTLVCHYLEELEEE